MATIKQFEDLICWQKARELTKAVYRICRNTDMLKTSQQKMARDRGLCDQIQRAAVSVMSNIAEGFERGTKFELINYFYIAKGSCAEVRCQLHVALDVGYIDMPTFRNIYGLADETGRLIESFVQKVKMGSKSGLQHKHGPEKKDTSLADAGLVFTVRGVMKKEEGEGLGLEALPS